MIHYKCWFTVHQHANSKIQVHLKIQYVQVKNISHSNPIKNLSNVYSGSSLHLKICSHISRKLLVYDRYHYEYKIYKSNTGRQKYAILEKKLYSKMLLGKYNKNPKHSNLWSTVHKPNTCTTTTELWCYSTETTDTNNLTFSSPPCE